MQGTGGLPAVLTDVVVLVAEDGRNIALGYGNAEEGANVASRWVG